MLRFFALLLALLVFPLVSTNAADYIIGLPKGMPPNIGKISVIQHIEDLIQHEMKTGDTLRVFNAFDIHSIAAIEIPNKKAFEFPKVRRKQFRRQIKSIKGYLGGMSNEDNYSDAVLLPQFLEHLSTHVVDSRKNEPVNVLVLGNALYKDDREDAFSMREGWFPSDGHLKVSQRHSVYGAAKKVGQLKNFTVHILHTNRPEEWYNDLYRHRIQRFWNLFVKVQGGVLSTFTQDTEAAFSRFAEGGLKPKKEYGFDYTANKVEMLRARREVVPSTIETTSQIPMSDGANFLEEGIPISNQPPITTEGTLKIGIRWPCNRCDLDLYARGSEDESYLYYRNVENSQGKYFKDFRSSPDTINGLEYITFTESVNVNDLQVMANFYSGSSEGGAEAVVRVFFQGLTYESPFRIEAETGNKGASRNTPISSKYWKVIDVPLILGLRG